MHNSCLLFFILGIFSTSFAYQGCSDCEEFSSWQLTCNSYSCGGVQPRENCILLWRLNENVKFPLKRVSGLFWKLMQNWQNWKGVFSGQTVNAWGMGVKGLVNAIAISSLLLSRFCRWYQLYKERLWCNSRNWLVEISKCESLIKLASANKRSNAVQRKSHLEPSVWTLKKTKSEELAILRRYFHSWELFTHFGHFLGHFKQ